MDKPNKVYPKSSTSVPSPMPNIIQDPSLYGAAFDQLLQNRGVRFIHKRAAACPNIIGVDENNHKPNCSFCDDSNIIYYAEKEIWGVFTSNNLDKMFEVQGVWEVGTAVVTFPAEYADGTQADFNTFDKLYCPDFQIRLTDLKEYEVTVGNIQKLRYPIIDIEYMSSVRNESLFTYQRGIDFNIVNGNIQWISGKQPQYNEVTEIGETLSIAYTTNPVYNVMHLLHEQRITQEYNVATGQKIARRLPQQCLLKRDYLMQKSE